MIFANNFAATCRIREYESNASWSNCDENECIVRKRAGPARQIVALTRLSPI